MIVSLCLAPRQIVFLCAAPTKQENLLSMLDGSFISYYDTQGSNPAVIWFHMHTPCKLLQNEVISPRVLFATASATCRPMCSLCKSAWVAYAFLLQNFHLTQFSILCHLIMCTPSAPHKLHVRPRRGLCLLHMQCLSRACREVYTEGLHVLRAHLWHDMDQQPGASPTVTMLLQLVPLTALAWQKCASRANGPWRDLAGGQTKNPFWLHICCASHSMCEQRLEVSKGDSGCHCQQNSPKPSLRLSFQGMSCSSALMLKNSLPFLFRQWWVGLAALLSSPVRTLIISVLSILHLFDALLLFAPMYQLRKPQSYWNTHLKSQNKTASET